MRCASSVHAAQADGKFDAFASAIDAFAHLQLTLALQALRPMVLAWPAVITTTEYGTSDLEPLPQE